MRATRAWTRGGACGADTLSSCWTWQHTRAASLAESQRSQHSDLIVHCESITPQNRAQRKRKRPSDKAGAITSLERLDGVLEPLDDLVASSGKLDPLQCHVSTRTKSMAGCMHALQTLGSWLLHQTAANTGRSTFAQGSCCSG